MEINREKHKLSLLVKDIESILVDMQTVTKSLSTDIADVKLTEAKLWLNNRIVELSNINCNK